MNLNGSELKMFTRICFATTSVVCVVNGILCARRGDSAESLTQIGLGLMFFLIGITQDFVSGI